MSAYVLEELDASIFRYVGYVRIAVDLKCYYIFTRLHGATTGR